MEMMATGAANFDLARFGMEVFRASPRQADVMIVAGRVSQKMAPVLRQVYDQMMEPKWVISMGVCASTGGMFNNYAIVQGVDQIVPVDVYAPGCPPGPETLIHSILTLHQKIRVGEITRRTATGTGAGIHLELRPPASRCGCRLDERHSRVGERDRPVRRRPAEGRPEAEAGRGRSRRGGAGPARPARLPARRRGRGGGGALQPRRRTCPS